MVSLSLRKIEVAIGLWTTVCIAAASVLVSRYTFSAMALFACAAISGLCLVFLVWTHRPGSRMRVGPLLIAAAGNAFCLGLLAFGFHDLLEPQITRFGFTRTTMFISDLDRKHVTPWRFWNGSLLPATPIQLLIGFILENEQPNPTTIVSYSLAWASAPRGPWQALCPVSSRGGELYWAFDPSKALEVSADDFADRKLIGARLPPFEPIQFKTAWECSNECSASYLKFSVTESNGHKSAAVFQKDSDEPKEMGLGEGFTVLGPSHALDMSRAAIAFDSQCKP
jgi:hypothetical protein